MFYPEQGMTGNTTAWRALFIIVLVLGCWVGGCSVGPNFVRPKATVSPRWLEEGDPRVKTSAGSYPDWWKTFNDPVLDQLIDRAYRENLSLRMAGVRVLEARAQLGIATGSLYPQVQQASGSLQRFRTSETSPLASFLQILPSGPKIPSRRQAAFSNTGRTRSGSTPVGSSISGVNSGGA